MKSRKLFWAGLMVAQGIARPLFAQPEDAAPAPSAATPSPGELAIQKGREGIALFEAGQWEQALALFRESDAVYHSPVFVLYAARSHRNLGRLIEARSLYLTLAAEKLSDAAPTTWRQAQIDGATELVALEQGIPIVVVTLEGATPSATVTVDGVAVAVGARTPQNPGEHRVVVVDGERTRSMVVTLGRSRSVSTVEVDLTRPEGGHGPVDEPGVDAWRVLGAVLTGVGGAGLLAGGVVGVLALDEASQAGQGLPRTCSPDRRCLDTDQAPVEGRFQAAYTMGSAADGLLIGGGISAAVGIVLLVLDPGGSTVASAAASSGGGFRVRF